MSSNFFPVTLKKIEDRIEILIKEMYDQIEKQEEGQSNEDLVKMHDKIVSLKERMTNSENIMEVLLAKNEFLEIELMMIIMNTDTVTDTDEEYECNDTDTDSDSEDEYDSENE
jgi:hypothetical protein